MCEPTRYKRAGPVLYSVAFSHRTGIISLFGIHLAHQLRSHHRHFIHVHAFDGCVHSKQLTVHSSFTFCFIVHSMCSLRFKPMTFVQRTTHRIYLSYFELFFQPCPARGSWCQEVINILMYMAWWHLCFFTQNGLYQSIMGKNVLLL